MIFNLHDFLTSASIMYGIMLIVVLLTYIVLKKK
jgi:hypothetical protein